MDRRCRPCPSPGRTPAVRLHLGEHPLHARQRNAARRSETVGVWQGHVHVRVGGLHHRSACDVQALTPCPVGAGLPANAVHQAHLGGLTHRIREQARSRKGSSYNNKNSQVLPMDITRRDFLNGVAITLAASMTPLQLLQAAPDGRYYPPALTGLRGSHVGSFEVAHQMGWEKKVFATEQLPITEDYDLVVVGGGLSGLSAAWFYREKHPKAKILILENHDDFGGHAKRNEFQAGGRMIIGYGGSEAFQSPKHLYSQHVNGLLKKLGVNIQRFETAFDRQFYPGLGLSRGVFFDKENFGEDKLVTGDPTPMVADDIAPDQLNARSISDFINDFPLPEADRQALIALHVAPKDYLPGKSAEEKAEYLAATSYRDFLLKDVGLSEGAVKYFQSRTNDFMALSIDAVASADARSEE